MMLLPARPTALLLRGAVISGVVGDTMGGSR